MKKKQTTDIFRQTLNDHKKYIYPTIFISIFVAYLPVAPIVYMRTVFGPVINSQSITFLFSLAFLLVLALVVNGFLEWIRERILLSATTSFVSTIEDKVFSATFEQGTEKWNEGGQAFGNLRTIRSFMTSPVAGAIFDAPFSLSLLIIIFLIHPLMGIFSLLGLFIALMIGLIIEKKLKPQQESAMLIQSKARRELSELHNNALYTNSMGNLPVFFHRWFKNQKQFLVHQSSASSMQAFGSSVTQVTMMVQGSMLLGVGTLLTLIGLMSPSMAGNLIIAKFIGALAIRPTMMIVMAWSQIIAVRESVTGIKKFLKELVVNPTSNLKLPPPKGKLTVRNLTYTMGDNEKKILDNINFSLEPGNICAVLGESGAGKSTLAKLLVGYLRPTKGDVRLDGVFVNTWDNRELCDHIGYLPQDLQLFGGDIVENITRYKEPDSAKLAEVIEEFDLIDVVDLANFQNNKHMSDDLFDMPGGLKQRIALARAFYNSPNFLVLDEPTSSLDADMENKFLSIIQKNKDRGASIIISTHNKRILTMADYILAIKDGRQKLFDSKQNIKNKMNLPLE